MSRTGPPAEHGPDELTTETLRVPPFDEMGTITELADRFGGADELRAALDGLGRYIYDVA